MRAQPRATFSETAHAPIRGGKRRRTLDPATHASTTTVATRRFPISRRAPIYALSARAVASWPKASLAAQGRGTNEEITP